VNQRILNLQLRKIDAGNDSQSRSKANVTEGSKELRSR
jgi:hypothetical protein